MRIRVRYFAAARERAESEGEMVELAGGADVAALLDVLIASHPALGPLLPRVRAAVNQEFVGPEHRLHEGDEVALIPPVAGGAGRVRIASEPLSLNAAFDAVRASGLGGIACFVGTVRAHNRGKRVQRLEYEAYPEMAEKVLARICEQAKARFGAEVSIHHRVGTLEVGETAVVIAAAAEHRAEAFDACRFAIEELKRDAPIWKKEHTDDGTIWVGLGP